MKQLDSQTHSSRFDFKAFGPGILLASAAIGGSHLVASTQAGALFGWQLAIMIVLANLFKYPFFRFATDYVYDTGESLISGYAKKSHAFLWVYFVLLLASAVISVGAIGLITATILGFLLPTGLGLSPLMLCTIVMIISLVFLLFGHYRLLDKVTKAIMICLTLATLIAVIIAGINPVVPAPDFVPTSPWNWATLGFIIALMGWMPTPIEFAAISSMWTARKIAEDKTNHNQGLLDFNVGYVVSTVLALLFLALGVFVQYGSGRTIETKGGAYIGQLIEMYTATIGDWSGFLVAFIAFMCMFGTLLTVADGYGRGLSECARLIGKKEQSPSLWLPLATAYAILGGLVIVAFFSGQLGIMLKFAMISAFVSAPIFAWLNYSLVRKAEKLASWLHWLSIAGLIFLVGFTAVFLVNWLIFNG